MSLQSTVLSSSSIKVTKPFTFTSILNLLIPKERNKSSRFLHLHSLPQVSIFLVTMRAKDNSILDLNNLPDDDPAIDIIPFSEEGSSSSSSSGGLKEKQTKDEKEYECRFCSLKFFKSQALGGHMNRHRQERETESLNKARELVLRNDNFPLQQGPSSFNYHQGDMHIGEVITTPYKPMIHQPTLFSISAVSSPSLVQPYLYPSTHSSFPQHHINDYYLSNNETRQHQTLTNSVVGDRAPFDSSYTYIGAPVASGSRAAPLSLPLPPHYGLYSKR